MLTYLAVATVQQLCYLLHCIHISGREGMALNVLFSRSSIFTHDHQTAVSPIPRTTTRTRSPLFFTIFTSHPSPPQKPISPNDKIQPFGETRKFPVHLSKRMLNLSILTVILSTHLPKAIAAEEKLELEQYTDSKEGFTLLKPSSWIKVDKAGATVLFEEPSKGANNVGVVVTPVRLTKLGEFGDPQFVADKLIQAEKRKESTKDAEVISVLERSGQGGLQVYEFEYKLDSTRGGMKRIFSAAFVASKKLYLLNIAHSDKPESPLDAERRLMLEQVLHSFDAAPST